MKLKPIPAPWVQHMTQLLRENLPPDVQGRLFCPDADFYAQYEKDPFGGLHYMAEVLLKWMKIQPNQYVIDFGDELEFSKSPGDTAGFYKKVGERDVIVINSKHKADPLKVGAILAHELTHLYLLRLGLRLQDVRENELLTDLATIRIGLSLLIINGMSYSADWHFTVIAAAFGWLYWHSEQLAFGYFQPTEYAEHSLTYFEEHRVDVADIIGYLAPAARHFVRHPLFLKSKTSTEFVRRLERRQRRSNLKKAAIAAPFAAFALYTWISNPLTSSNRSAPSRRIEPCKAALTALAGRIKADQDELLKIDTRRKLQGPNNLAEYDSLIGTYKKLKEQVNQEVSDYKSKRAQCDSLVAAQ